jgi:hypothetical protein
MKGTPNPIVAAAPAHTDRPAQRPQLERLARGAHHEQCRGGRPSDVLEVQG